MEAVNFPERLLNGDWNCTSGNCFYIAPHITAKITNFIVSKKCLENLKPSHITAKITNFILSNLVAKNCLTLLQKLPISYFPPIAQKTITAKITNFIFTTQCQEKHYCKSYQFHISRQVPIKNTNFIFPAHCPEKITNFIFPARCPEKISNFIFPALCPENPQIYPNWLFVWQCQARKWEKKKRIQIFKTISNYK